MKKVLQALLCMGFICVVHDSPAGEAQENIAQWKSVAQKCADAVCLNSLLKQAFTSMGEWLQAKQAENPLEQAVTLEQLQREQEEKLCQSHDEFFDSGCLMQ